MKLKQFFNKNIIFAPKNDLTILLKRKLEKEGLTTIGFIDNYKEDMDILKDYKLTDNDIVIVYSPNHYQAIAEAFNPKNTFIFSSNLIKDSFEENIVPLQEFKEYKINKDSNSFDFQKFHWESFLFNYDKQNTEQCGYEWGDPQKEDDPLGNYKKINSLLNKNIDQNSSVLELGTLGGKWTKYMLEAKSITCVDINEYFIEFIQNRYSEHLNKFKFYVSLGNELKGIKENSIDLIFCMDTLVRVEKKFIFDYLKEIKRVLKKEAKAIIHLPNWDLQDCKDRNFTKLSFEEIKNELNKYFDNYTLDSNTIIHGTLVYINIKE